MFQLISKRASAPYFIRDMESIIIFCEIARWAQQLPPTIEPDQWRKYQTIKRIIQLLKLCVISVNSRINNTSS